MPSFDIVSEVDKHEMTNAVDQAKRDLENRYDLRGTNASFTLEGFVVSMTAPSEFNLEQMTEMLHKRLAGRHIDLRALEAAKNSAARLVGKILDAARRSVADDRQTNYSAKGKSQAYKTSTLSLSVDQKL